MLVTRILSIFGQASSSAQMQHVCMLNYVCIVALARARACLRCPRDIERQVPRHTRAPGCLGSQMPGDVRGPRGIDRRVPWDESGPRALDSHMPRA